MMIHINKQTEITYLVRRNKNLNHLEFYFKYDVKTDAAFMHIFMDLKLYDTCIEIGVNKYLLM